MKLSLVDSCAVLALFLDEPGVRQKMEQLLPGRHSIAETGPRLHFTRSNWAEVFTRWNQTTARRSRHRRA